MLIEVALGGMSRWLSIRGALARSYSEAYFIEPYDSRIEARRCVEKSQARRSSATSLEGARAVRN
jgi:hypothetical protein